MFDIRQKYLLTALVSIFRAAHADSQQSVLHVFIFQHFAGFPIVTRQPKLSLSMFTAASLTSLYRACRHTSGSVRLYFDLNANVGMLTINQTLFV